MMPSLHNAYGLLGCALIILVIVASVLGLWIRSRSVLRSISALVVVLSFVPFGGISVAELLRGVTGDIAVTTFLMCVVALTRCLSRRGNPNAQAAVRIPWLFAFFGGTLTGLFAGVLAVGCVFYPMTVGFSLIDPYAWGYSPHWMLLGCLLMTVAFEFAGQRTAANLILVPVGAYALRLMESTNLWDYLLDPILFLACFVGCIVKAVVRLPSSRRARSAAC